MQNNGIVVVQNNGKEMYQKVCGTCKFFFLFFFFLLIRSIDFAAVLIAVAVYHRTILFFVYKYINESFAFSPG